MFSPGSIIDKRYEVIAPLAEGGMGAVYRARRVLLGDEVAIKIVRGDTAGPAARERFLRESRVAASLRHPSIVSILDFDIPEDGPPYLVMELLSGPSLREEIDARRRLDLADVARILPGICAALDVTHAHGIVHRDIKPANIVRHDYGAGEHVYKLVDFGIANLRQTTDDTRLTGTHQFLGTVAYASPEQLSGAELDGRSDIYSLAAVVFEMLTGRTPFSGDLMGIVSAHLATPAPLLTSVRPGLPVWLESAIAKGLAKAPADRWQTAAQFRAALSLSETQDAPTQTSDRPIASGGLAGVYDLGEFVGRGRMGSDLYRGVHRALGHSVAIRILRSDAHPNWSAVRERFLREARALQIAHPSVIQVRDFGEEAGSVYVVTDFIPGPSVRTVIQEHGAIPWARLRVLLAQLFEAARLLHRKKVLLCGLSPDIMRICPPDACDPEAAEDGERIMISTTGIWSARDLLSTLHERTLRGLALEDLELRYVAPELLTGGEVNVQSDIFTLGVVAYEMATGKPPYDGKSMPELLGRMLAGAPEDPRAHNPDMPERAAAAILKALRPSPADRFATVKAFAAELG